MQAWNQKNVFFHKTDIAHHIRYLLDYDKVDSHNLNRQLLFGVQDENKSKVFSALKSIQHHNVGHTEIVPME